jgi:hypothetical protein
MMKSMVGSVENWMGVKGEGDSTIEGLRGLYMQKAVRTGIRSCKTLIIAALNLA